MCFVPEKMEDRPIEQCALICVTASTCFRTLVICVFSSKQEITFWKHTQMLLLVPWAKAAGA